MGWEYQHVPRYTLPGRKVWSWGAEPGSQPPAGVELVPESRAFKGPFGSGPYARRH
jgi:hypothetical protein